MRFGRISKAVGVAAAAALALSACAGNSGGTTPSHCCGSRQDRRIGNGRRGERVQHVQPEHG